MKEFLEITVKATPEDVKLVKQIMASTIGRFKDYLKVTKRTTKLTVTEFTVLYYDLDYFLRKDLMQNQFYSVKDLRSFSISFRQIFEKLVEVCYLEEAYLQEVFESNSEKFADWLSEVTEALPVSR